MSTAHVPFPGPHTSAAARGADVSEWRSGAPLADFVPGAADESGGEHPLDVETDGDSSFGIDDDDDDVLGLLA